MPPGRRSRAPAVTVTPDRFAAGWRLVPDAPVTHLRAEDRTPSLVVDLVRPRDLVALTIEGYDLELVGGEDPHLRARRSGEPLLVVRLPFQHLAERAIYEAAARIPDETDPTGSPKDEPAADDETTRPIPPTPARPARDSRLVFGVPAGTTITFSIAGILAAMRELPLVVHPLALPRQGPPRMPVGGPLLHLPDGLVATRGPDGLVVSVAPRGVARPDPTSATGLATLARDQRRIRNVLATASGTPVKVGAGRGVDDPIAIAIARVDHTIRSILGDGGLVVERPPVRRRTRPVLSRPAEALETAIEAPFRLVISPSERGGWAHADLPVPATDAAHHVELWHTRLGVRTEADDTVAVDERTSDQRIVRALWARDRERYPAWQDPGFAAPHDIDPFRSSLDGADRHMLVRQSAETWVGQGGTSIPPQPVDATRLWLSSLGAWLDLHGSWDTEPYSAVQMPSILLWDHVAPMGRDQYVRVVYPGYLYPFGHRATLVKVTERKMKDASPSVAGLYQRMFIVVSEPLKVYDQRDLPFTQVRLAPLVTPTIDPPGDAQNTFFWPEVGGADFTWILHAEDREGQAVRLVSPLLWVAEHFGAFADLDAHYRDDPRSRIPAHGQTVAFAPVARGGDTASPTDQLRFVGAAQQGTSVPHLADAKVHLQAVEQLAPVGAVSISYNATYLQHGLGGAANVGEVWADVAGAPPLSFGGSPSAGSDRAGGFLQPDLPIRALSRAQGVVGDPVATATGGFDPSAFLAGALPKLFGLVPLDQLLEVLGVDLGDAPTVVSETVDRIEGFLADLERAARTVEDAVADAQHLVDRAADDADEVQAQAAAALAAARSLRDTVTTAVDELFTALSGLTGSDATTIESALAAPLEALATAVDLMEQVAPQLPPLVRNRLHTLAATLRTVLDAAELLDDVLRFLHGLASSSVTSAFRFEWSPTLRSWPDPTDPILEVRPDSLVIAVDGRAGGSGGAGVEVLAELRDFTLHLLPGAPLVRFRFDHLSFRAGSTGKTEVDVVLGDIEFVGLLGFVEVLKDIIPFDGFSDPPYLDVSPAGVTAGFSLALPNVAVGVFSLSNISLGADLRVPFLGDVVTVGFNFCTRERPFTLAVVFIGGGGWFAMRLSPDGLDLLELGLEAGATLSIDLGVASGSISAMIGVYLRLEGDGGSLTGYFRLRGEVDVLGIISASIELYLALHYDFPTGKMVGEASLTIKIEVFVFSGSVTIRCQRSFAGSNGDPSFREVMGVVPGAAQSPAWSTYCAAFAGA